MSETEQQFLDLIDKAISADSNLVLPADEEQLNRLSDLLGVDRQDQ